VFCHLFIFVLHAYPTLRCRPRRWLRGFPSFKVILCRLFIVSFFVLFVPFLPLFLCFHSHSVTLLSVAWGCAINTAVCVVTAAVCSAGLAAFSLSEFCGLPVVLWVARIDVAVKYCPFFFSSFFLSYFCMFVPTRRKETLSPDRGDCTFCRSLLRLDGLASSDGDHWRLTLIEGEKIMHSPHPQSPTTLRPTVAVPFLHAHHRSRPLPLATHMPAVCLRGDLHMPPMPSVSCPIPFWPRRYLCGVQWRYLAVIAGQRRSLLNSYEDGY
jgi:hypothetical protein